MNYQEKNPLFRKTMRVTAIITVISIILIIPNAYAVIESSTEYGSLKMDKEVYVMIHGEQTMIKANGTVNNVQGGERLNFVMILPDGLTDGLHTTPTDDGYYEVFWMIDDDTQIGQYKVSATYEGILLGKITFEIKEKEYSEQELLTARQLLDQIKEKTETKAKEPIPEELDENILFNQDVIKKAEDKIRLNNKCQETSFETSSDFDKYLECCKLEPVRERHECKQDLMEQKKQFIKEKILPVIPVSKYTPSPKVISETIVPKVVTSSQVKSPPVISGSIIVIVLFVVILFLMVRKFKKPTEEKKNRQDYEWNKKRSQDHHRRQEEERQRWEREKYNRQDNKQEKKQKQQKKQKKEKQYSASNETEFSVIEALDILNVNNSATPKMIKQAQREMVLKYHPDKHQSTIQRKHAEIMMKNINIAFETLQRANRV